MSKLIAMIDEWKDAHGRPSDSSIARAIGVAPQTISSWRTRGIRKLPETETLRSLAAFLHRDYATEVIPAAMNDAGYITLTEAQDIAGERGKLA